MKNNYILLLCLFVSICFISIPSHSEELKNNVIPNDDNEFVTEQNFESENLYKWSIGCLLPITGKYSILGDKALRGLRVAVESSNTGSNYKIIVKDTESTLEGVKLGIKSIYSEITPSFILGPIPSIHARQSKEIINKYSSSTLIFPVFKDNSVNGKKFINFYLPVEMQIKKLADYATIDLNLKKFGVLYPNTKYGKTFYNNFSNHITKRGGKILYQGNYESNLNNIDVELEWLKAYDIEALLIPDGATKSSVIIKKIISDTDINNIIFLGTSNWNSNIFLNLVGRYLDGVLYKAIFIDYFSPRSKDWIEFSQIYQNIFNEKSGSFEFQIYKSVKLLMKYNGEDTFSNLKNLDNSEFVVKERASGIDIYPNPKIYTIEEEKIIGIR